MSPDYYRSLIDAVLRVAGSSNPSLDPPPPKKEEASPATIKITIELPVRAL